MKTLRTTCIPILALVIFSYSCRKNNRELIQEPEKKTEVILQTTASRGIEEPVPETGTCNPNAYIVKLESKTQVGSNWEWIWSVQNPNPGNGKNGTVQDLSHWGMQFGNCFLLSSVVDAAYSGDGITWTSFIPVYQVDPSQTCMNTQVMKFDFGTTGSAKSYYKLVVREDYPADLVTGYYKSGNNTGCCTFGVIGISCGVVK